MARVGVPACHRRPGCTIREAETSKPARVVVSDRIEGWDRGFDAAGQQVWRAEQGPYLFVRKADE